MRRRAMLVAALAVLTLAGNGCTSRAIKEGVGAVTGPQAVVVPITQVANAESRPLGAYTRFTLEPFKDASGIVPQRVNDALAAKLLPELKSKGLPNDPSGKELVVRGTYVFYQSASGVAAEVSGPFEEVIARVQLVDGASGKALGEAFCIGRTTQTVNQGPEDKAEGLSKAIADWVDDLYPQPEEGEKQEEQKEE